MKFIELFAGIGGFRYGLENISASEGIQQGRVSRHKPSNIKPQLGTEQFTCVWANEIDKYAAEIYRKNFGEEELYEGDIRNVITGDIPEHELLVGGFPCQAFSIAGKRAGFNDCRGTLFFEIARILTDKRPRCVLLENVKGLLSHDSGKTFQTILKVLSDIGYRTEWQVLNSKDFGVPQNRERVFIIGHLRGQSGGQVFPIGGSRSEDKRDNKDLEPRVYDAYNKKFRSDTICGTLTKETAGRKDLSQGFKVVEDMRIRRLTPTECERLQGFPDGWTEGISDTQRYKCLGNAVTTNVIQAIGEKLCQT